MAVTDRAKLQEERAALAARVERLEAQLALRGRTPVSEIARLENEMNRLKHEKEVVEHDLAAAEALLATLADDRSQAVVERNMMAEQLDIMADRLGRLAEDNKPTLARLNDMTMEGMNAAERTVVMTGLDSNKLLMRMGLMPQPQGGPFLAAAAAPAGGQQIDLAERIAYLGNQFDRLDGLRRILAALPLAPPLDNGWSTAAFGRRKDPFTGEWAHHTGVDLAAEAGSTILATAPGRTPSHNLSFTTIDPDSEVTFTMSPDLSPSRPPSAGFILTTSSHETSPGSTFLNSWYHGVFCERPSRLRRDL